MRYDRYTNKDPLNNDKEKKSLIKFIEKYLKIKISNDFLSVSQNNKSTKQFVGEVIKSIAVEQYEIITKEATRLNIYIDDIRRYSKAYKIFILQEFNFEFENRVQRELFLKFLSDDKSSPLIAFTKELKPLEFDCYDENWIFRCKGRHDSDTKYATHSTTKVARIPLERSPLIPEQSTPLYS